MWMEILKYGVLSLYLLCLALVVIYSMGQVHLIYLYYKNRKKVKSYEPLSGNESLPFVTIQLPLYNEMYVVERLLDAATGQDYPKDRFEIQVLDDSDDESVQITAAKVAALRAQGYLIEHVRRPERKGYKAGALAYGLQFAKGEYVAIFDADFLPRADFLRALLPYFDNEKTGVVQARWEHLNQHYSILTEIQAFFLDAHFTIEQFSRSVGGYFMNFNGTAGIWRRVCIDDAGGWEADTLTEDLDLSYRAQMKGWKFRYVDHVGAPAELPAEMNAIKSQQYRWMKGGAEVARKMLGKVWRSKAPFVVKLHSTMHLLSSSIFLLVLTLGATSVPLLYLKHELFNGHVEFLLIPVSLLMISSLVLAVLYTTTVFAREDGLISSLKRMAINYVPFLSMTMGMSLHNSIAVLQGYMGKKTPFIRTPKFNITQKSDRWQGVKYKTRKIKPGIFLELFLAAYFFMGVYFSFRFDDMAVLPFFLMQFLGFAAVGLVSFKHALTK